METLFCGVYFFVLYKIEEELQVPQILKKNGNVK